MGVVERSLAHDAVDGEAELLLDLRRASSGTAGSPRRARASSSCAAAIARSPPLVATYTVQASICVVRGIATSSSPATRNASTPAGEAAGHRPQRTPGALREPLCGEPALGRDAGAGEPATGVRLQPGDLHDERCAALGLLVGALREDIPRRQAGRVGDHREVGRAGRRGERTPAMKPQVLDDGRAGGARTEPDCGVGIGQGEAQGGGRGVQRRWRLERAGQAGDAPGVRHRVERHPERALRVEDRIGEAGAKSRHPSPRTSVKKSTRVPAARAEIASRRATAGAGKRLDQVPLDGGAARRILEQGVQEGGEFRSAGIGAGHVPVADRSIRQRDGAAADRHFSEIEALARPAGARAQHHEARLGTPQAPVRGRGRDQRGERGFHLLAGGAGQHGHPARARRGVVAVTGSAARGMHGRRVATSGLRENDGDAKRM